MLQSSGSVRNVKRKKGSFLNVNTSLRGGDPGDSVCFGGGVMHRGVGRKGVTDHEVRVVFTS
jgi:hypothetical protein